MTEPRCDTPETRERLLDSAERLFAERGFDGISVREITTDASCNIAAVNYHFGTKDLLYVEVGRRLLTELREQRLLRLRTAFPPAGAAPQLVAVLRTFTDAFMEPMVDSSRGRTLMTLLAREMIDPHLPPGMFLEEMVRPVAGALAGALRRAEPRLDERAAMLAVQSLVGQLMQAVHMERLLPAGPTSLHGVERSEVVEHIVQFTLGGIEHLVEERT